MEKREKSKKYGDKIFIFIAIIFCFVNLTILITWFIYQRGNYIARIFSFLFTDFTIASATYFVIVFKQSIETDKTISKYQQYLERTIIEEDDNREKDVLFLMLNNNKEISEYFEISKKQEKFSYGISVGCAIVGVIMLVISIVAVFFNERIETTIISTISGAITELVSGIVLWIHNKSAMQLNFYYNSLHENEKFLSAINMVDRLKDENSKDQIYMDIIKAQIKMSNETKEKE